MAFSFVMSAYSAEVFRSGIEGIPRGQFEAAHALGLPFLLTLRKVILPQAIRLVIPPTTSNCVSMFKDTALASVVALPELLKEANNAQALYANPSPLIGAALVYLIFLWPMVRLVSLLEKRFQTEKTH
jgi:polar amino acid transport system permease protein